MIAKIMSLDELEDNDFQLISLLLDEYEKKWKDGGVSNPPDRYSYADSVTERLQPSLMSELAEIDYISYSNAGLFAPEPPSDHKLAFAVYHGYREGESLIDLADAVQYRPEEVADMLSHADSIIAAMRDIATQTV